VDEANCNFEKVTLCAFNQTKVGQAGVSTRADFLICLDETKETNDAVAAATPCAAKSSLDMPTIKTCYNGAQGMALLTTASTLWNHYFPSPTTIPKVRAAGTALSLSLSGKRMRDGHFLGRPLSVLPTRSILRVRSCSLTKERALSSRPQPTPLILNAPSPIIPLDCRERKSCARGVLRRDQGGDLRRGLHSTRMQIDAPHQYDLNPNATAKE
jgi:hypothetical protein